MSIEEVIAKLLEEVLKGNNLVHSGYEKGENNKNIYAIYNQWPVNPSKKDEIFFMHYASSFEAIQWPYELKLHDAVELVKHFWHRRAGIWE
jgi:hypothetical protein